MRGGGLLLGCLFIVFLSVRCVVNSRENGDGDLVPLELGKTMVLMNGGLRRQLNSFQVCSLCMCCASKNNYCSASPCCYAINCNIPNRPFGVCSFTPKTCNCLQCHI